MRRLTKILVFSALLLGGVQQHPMLVPATTHAVENWLGKVLGKGIASHYGTGDGFAGRVTASGETFNPQDMTCAHKTLPFGTRVRVEIPGTRRWVIVRVNDRGPFVKGRVIDLSSAAARRLGIRGLCRVVIREVTDAHL